ncbi:unnamed protein product, partial [Onchocerca flexuosa]|uniref:SH3 domain-containing protein n=1 Tax=Onchocerca flexuosa TaxID=387005 RepID=A0A183HCL0_9BILA
GKFNAAFGTAKNVFDAVKKPEIQRKLITASKNETVRSAVSLLAKNEGARKVALNALQDERTLKTAYDIAQACDRQQQQKNLVNLKTIPSGTSISHDATSKFDAKKTPTSIYPSLPPLRDNVYNSDYKTTDNFTVTPNQPISQNFSQPNFTSETNAFTSVNQEEQPHGHAKFRYLASCFDELSAEPFDMIILEKKVDDQWVYALNKRTGKKGIIPLLYIDVKIPLPTVLSTPQIPFHALALFDFDSNVSGDLTFRANDEIYVIERINNDWLRGSIGMRQGIFPANYIREIPAPTTMTSESMNFHASAEYVNALYDYNSAIEDDLIFRAGDRIEVLEWVSKDWLRGKLNGKIGLVPRTYIEDCSRNDDAGKQLNVTKTVVTATKDYYNVSKDHLCFSKGDKIEVIEEVYSLI